MQFSIIHSNNNSYPRVGMIQTEHGDVMTPTYMPVGTFGPVKLLDVDELKSAGASMILGNSYHLDSTASSQRINKLGGLANFTGWKGPTLTDSGGYQVSYMWRSGTHSLENGERKHGKFSPIEKITDDGVRVRSIITGQRYWMTPESVMETQALIGADIVMTFDQPTFDTDSFLTAKETLKRTYNWISRSMEHWLHLKDQGIAPAWQRFFPIIQGGRYKELRRESAKFVVDLDTFGLAVAGESIGIDPDVSAETLDMIIDLVPYQKPLYAMGLGGGPEGFFKAVLHGVDMFDNTSPMRLGRCGLVFIKPESGGTTKNHFRLDLNKTIYREDSSALDSACSCKTCTQYSKAYLHHLIKIKDPLGARLLSYHNVYFMCHLSSLIQKSILDNKFTSLYNEWIK